ncbi:MAG: hypothetical protein JNJ54_05775 [Myxococcaceae bacterium]|nr:hypothetical protein [Myxococcaceae bacterium]
MTKRLVDIDPELLERARAVAGTRTIKATVEFALKRVANDELLRRHLASFKTPGNFSLKALEQARSPRRGPRG